MTRTSDLIPDAMGTLRGIEDNQVYFLRDKPQKPRKVRKFKGLLSDWIRNRKTFSYDVGRDGLRVEFWEGSTISEVLLKQLDSSEKSCLVDAILRCGLNGEYTTEGIKVRHA